MLTHDLLHPSNRAAHQADFDAVWMRGRTGQDIFDDAFRQFTRGLILLENDQHFDAGFDVGAFCTSHNFTISENLNADDKG